MIIFLIILAFFLAAGLSFYQYFLRNSSTSKTTYILATLRFLAVFCLLLLLINPIVSSKSFEIQKAPLCIAIDNSGSITMLEANKTAENVFLKLTESKTLNDKFEIQKFQFDAQCTSDIKLDFRGKQTDIDQVAKNIENINKNRTFATVLISDGNQTKGNDFVYSFDGKNKIYPVVLGDTTTFLDLKIGQVNVNKYAFQKNKFPVEVFLEYAGNKSVNANLKISLGNEVLSTQTIAFLPTKKSVIVDLLLPANNIGVQIFKATVTSTEKEKNTYNNSKNFAVEVIDQRNNVAIVSSIIHPDIGALKRSIETNAQRKVSIVKPQEISSLEDTGIFILYQPNADFKSVFDLIKKTNGNQFIITGTNTDFEFLNQNQSTFDFKMSNQKEDYLARFDANFNLFATDNIGFEQLPPLQNSYGTIAAKDKISVLLNATIRNLAIDQPLMAFADNQGKRSAFLFGENSWKWRLQSHVNEKNFEKYDVFIDKTIQFLATNNSKKSLIVNHENFYNTGDNIEVSAQYFNKNYEFDENAKLTIAVLNKKTKASKNFDLLKSNNDFKVNLDGLAAGQYSFAVKELNSKATYNGFFEILDFDIEKQFVNPNLQKLQQVAAQTNGIVYMPNQIDQLIKTLIENPEYKAIEKEIVKKSPFIDWVWLLIFCAFCLATEWFLRKYNGML